MKRFLVALMLMMFSLTAMAQVTVSNLDEKAFEPSTQPIIPIEVKPIIPCQPGYHIGPKDKDTGERACVPDRPKPCKPVPCKAKPCPECLPTPHCPPQLPCPEPRPCDCRCPPPVVTGVQRPDVDLKAVPLIGTPCISDCPPETGHWLTAVGVDLGPKRSYTASWWQHRDPGVKIDEDKALSIYLMHGYIFKNGLGIGGKVGWEDEPDVDGKWNPKAPGAHGLKVNGESSNFSFGVYGQYQWGKAGK